MIQLTFNIFLIVMKEFCHQIFFLLPKEVRATQP